MKKYLIAVEIEEGLGQYEVFDYVLFEPNYEDGIKRWSEATSQENYIKDCTGMKNLTLLATLDNDRFIPVDGEFDHSTVFTDRIFGLISDNKVYGIIFVNKGSEKEVRYDHAISSKVIAIDASNYEKANLGYIWNGTDFIKPEDSQDI